MRSERGQKGVTLIELIIAIIIYGIAYVGITKLFAFSAMASADPMVKYQAVAIAESYLEEIMLLAFDEEAASGTAEGALGPDAGETARTDFDDVNDYDGWTDSGARDLGDNPLSGLNTYSVAVTVTQDNSYDATVPAADSQLVTVTVTSQVDPSLNISVSGYRLKF